MHPCAVRDGFYIDGVQAEIVFPLAVAVDAFSRECCHDKQQEKKAGVGEAGELFQGARYGKKSLYTFLGELVETFRVRYLFKKPRGCRSCNLRLICPGFHRDFLKKNAAPEVFPYREGELVRNPLYFAAPRYNFKFKALELEESLKG